MSAPTPADPPTVLDATTLPRTATRGRSSVYWGVILLIAIEAVVLLTMITSYFYLAVVRGGEFPHQNSQPPDPTWSAIALSLSALALVPVHFAERAARLGRVLTMRLSMGVSALLGAGCVAFGVMDMRGHDHLWTSHAYGSIVWSLGVHQALHVTLALSATTALIGFSRAHRFDGERRAPIQALGAYWDFVVVAGALSFFTLYLSPRLM